MKTETLKTTSEVARKLGYSKQHILGTAKKYGILPCVSPSAHCRTKYWDRWRISMIKKRLGAKRGRPKGSHKS